MAVTVVKVSLEAPPRGAMQRGDQSVVIRVAGIAVLRDNAEARIGSGFGKPQERVGGGVRVNRRIAQHFVVTVVAHIVHSEGGLDAKRLLDLQVPLPVLRVLEVADRKSTR